MMQQLVPLTNVEQLMIRGCKTIDPTTRLMSIYRRFWYATGLTEDQQWDVVVGVLEQIVTKYHPEFTVRTLIDQMNPSNFEWRYYNAKNRSYGFGVAQVLINHIRHSPIDVYPNFRSPARFRIATQNTVEPDPERAVEMLLASRL